MIKFNLIILDSNPHSIFNYFFNDLYFYLSDSMNRNMVNSLGKAVSEYLLDS